MYEPEREDLTNISQQKRIYELVIEAEVYKVGEIPLRYNK